MAGMIKKIGQDHWKCLKCQKQYKRIYHIKRHIKTVHFKEKMYKCKVCIRKFGQKASLTRHMSTMHKDKRIDIKCPNCKKVVFYRRGRVFYSYGDSNSKEVSLNNEEGKFTVGLKSGKTMQFWEVPLFPTISQIRFF